jgi:hypothetical protein
LVDIVVDVSMDTSADSIRVVGEADLLDLARVARSTWKHWIKVDLVDEPKDGLYREADVVEAVVVSLLVPSLGLRRATGVWRAARTDALSEVRTLASSLHLVIDLHTWELRLAKDARELYACVAGRPSFPRGYVVVDLSQVVPEAREAFWNRAEPASTLKKDERRRKRSQQVS